MNLTVNLLGTTLALLAVAAVFAQSAAFAQKQTTGDDRVLVTGQYTVRQSDIDVLTEFYEWLLEARFTTAQRRRFETLTVDDARARKNTAKSILEIVEGFRKIRAAGEQEREKLRREFLPEVVAALEKEENEVNGLLLDVYRAASGATAQRTPADDANDDDPPIGAGAGPGNGERGTKVADLAGIWSTSSVSGIRYKSLVTGELSDPNGSIIEYQISPNGEIKHVGYLSSTVYSCTTKLFISRTGRVSINGSRITFDFAPGKRMYQTCSASASRNDTLPAERKTHPFRIERDQYGLKLCTIEDGKDFCLYKKGE